MPSLVGSEMCIRDRCQRPHRRRGGAAWRRRTEGWPQCPRRWCCTAAVEETTVVVNVVSLWRQEGCPRAQTPLEPSRAPLLVLLLPLRPMAGRRPRRKVRTAQPRVDTTIQAALTVRDSLRPVFTFWGTWGGGRQLFIWRSGSKSYSQSALTSCCFLFLSA